jgi:hypothetical protein
MSSQNLQEQVEWLENQISLLMQLVDPARHPFSYHMLEAKATKKQVDATLDLMDEAKKKILNNNPMNNHEFEKKVYEIFPTKDGSYGFAEGIVGTLNDTHQFTEVFNYYSKNGMNLIP